MYADGGRRSIPPERLLKATILMALYTVRSERQFCEQLNHNLLFRWFLDMDISEQGWEHSSFTRNRERLLKREVAEKLFYAVGNFRKTPLVGLAKNKLAGFMVGAAYNLVRLAKTGVGTSSSC